MKFTPQHDQMDCGPACLSMIASHYGKTYTIEYLREISFISREGVSLLGIKDASNIIGFESLPAKISIKKLLEIEESLPCILHWNHNHFVVLYKISKNFFTKKYFFHIADPAHGFVKLSYLDFTKSWIVSNQEGIALFLNPTVIFFKKEIPKQKKLDLLYILRYLKPHKKRIIYMFILLLFGSGLTLIFPFLTQNLIDKGVNKKNLSFISIHYYPKVFQK